MNWVPEGDALARLRPFFHDAEGAPEIAIRYAAADPVRAALSLVLEHAGPTAGGDCVVWPLPREPRGEGGFHQASRPFAGPEDAALVATGRIEPFWFTAGELEVDGTRLPKMLVIVRKEAPRQFEAGADLVLDVETGPNWDDARIRSFLGLVRKLEAVGGTVMEPTREDWEEDTFLPAFHDDPWQG